MPLMPDLRGQNVLKTFKMAIRPKRRKTRTELESFVSLDLFSLNVQNYISGSLRRCDRSHPLPRGSARSLSHRPKI